MATLLMSQKSPRPPRRRPGPSLCGVCRSTANCPEGTALPRRRPAARPAPALPRSRIIRNRIIRDRAPGRFAGLARSRPDARRMAGGAGC